MTTCDRVALFLAGELGPEETAEFRRHLPDCQACQGALHMGLMVEAAKTPRSAWAALRGRVAAYPMAAAMAALALLIPPARLAVGLAPVALEDGPTRNHREWIDGPFEEQHFPYQAASRVYMSGDALVADLGSERSYEESQRRIDWLLEEKRLLASAANALIHSDERRARVYLKQLEDLVKDDAQGDPKLTASLLNGQAVLELRQADRFETASCDLPWSGPLPRAEQQGACEERTRHLARALTLLEKALERAPGHAPSMFNRGVVLESLGLKVAAAKAFEDAARQGVEGWSKEAREEADRLRLGAETERTRLQRLEGVLEGLLQAVPRAQEGAPAETEKAMASVAAAVGMVAELRQSKRDPERLRKRLYRVASMGTAFQRRLLVPLAEALDGPSSPMAARLARLDTATRGPLLQRYLKHETLSQAELNALVVDLDRAQEDESLIWVLELHLPQRDLPVTESFFERMKQREPFTSLLATRLLAQRRLSRGDVQPAIGMLRSLAESCDVKESSARCAEIELWLLWAYYSDGERWNDAYSRGLRGLALADQGSDLWLWFVDMMALVASARNDPWLGLAYANEQRARASQCSAQVSRALERIAAIRLYSLLDWSGALQSLGEVVEPEGCPPGELSLIGVDVLTSLAASGQAPGWDDRLSGALEQQRKLTEGQTISRYFEYQMARAILLRSRQEGRAALEALASDSGRGRPEVTTAKVRSYAHRDLALDFGKTGEFDRAFELVARQLRLKPPDTCALTVTSDLGRTVVAARDDHGRFHGRYVQNGWRWVDRGGGQLVPDAVRRALTGCAEVAVLASPGVFGLTRLLDGLPWSYRVPQSHSGQAARSPHRVVVANTQPPAALLLERLTPWAGRRDLPGTVVLEHGQASITRVMRELPAATEIEFYTHGIQKLNDAEGAYLALTPDAELKGEFRLTAADVRTLSLDGAPYVYLKACVTADAGLQNDTNRSLASAFVERGARAVFASTVSIPDVDADRFFNAIREQIQKGATPAAALFNVREMASLDGQAQSWMDDVVCLQPG